MRWLNGRCRHLSKRHEARVTSSRRPGALVSLNETCCGKLLAACCPAHPEACRCCNPCPKSKGRPERLARPRKIACHFSCALRAEFSQGADVTNVATVRSRPYHDRIISGTANRPAAGSLHFRAL